MITHLPPLAGPPHGPDADPHLPEVRIDVRTGSGRATGYDLTRGEFLIGGADGCDLKLTGTNLPPVVCQFTRSPDGVKLRRLAPAFPILLNGSPLTSTTPVPIAAGDRVAVGSADIFVSIHGRGHLHPQFHPQVASPAHTETPSVTQFTGDRAELDRYRDQLAQQARELEADRVAWYRRRQEVEAEVRALQDSVTADTRMADRESWLQKREAEVASREQELARVREELSEIRQTLFNQYREQRSQLEQMQQVVRGASSTFQERQAEYEADLARRRAELDAEASRLQEYVSAEVTRRVSAIETQFARRRLELETEFDQKLRQFDQQAADRRTQFADELRHLDPQRHAENSEREKQWAQLTALRDELARERVTLEAERNWHAEQQVERERVLQSREAELARQRELVHTDRETLEQERQRLADDLLRLNRWQAAVEDRQLQLDHRAKEIDQQVKQLTRDAVELEEHVRLADAEQQRLTSENERLDRLKQELETRSSRLSERSAQMEAQQASLAVLRAQLDRQQHDLHREMAALTADRIRQDAVQRELDKKLQEAEQIRASLGSFHTTHAQAEQAVAERQALLDATLSELRQQRELQTAEGERLRRMEAELDARSADIAEQTAVLKAKTAEVLDLRERLEADRSAVRTREATLIEADSARGAFQEQLRKRADDLATRSRELDQLSSQLADDRLALDRHRAELAQNRERVEQELSAMRQRIEVREEELKRQSHLLAEREASLERQVNRLRETGRTVAAGRKELFASKQQWQTEQALLSDQMQAVRRELEEARARARTEFDSLRTQAPALEDQAVQAIGQLAAAREVLRGQLAELHAYATQSRDTLDSIRSDLRAEMERLRSREAELEKARTEHRLAVSEFRSQLHDWQSKVAELKAAMARSETRIDQKQAELEAASRKTDETALELARRMEQLRIDRDDLAERRTQMERHLADMREWYRQKLRDLAAEKRDVELPPAPPPRLVTAGDTVSPDDSELEPGDRHLGELLQSLELIDADTLNTLWAGARQQRRTLRQMLLASGAITLYQLALIEAGNLDALMLGRFRVIDRIRANPRETVYRAFDPRRATVCILRLLGDAEMHDATRPDEYRQRFTTATHAIHPNLPTTFEVLEVNGRPAAVQEYVGGLPGSEWPSAIAVPGVWLRVLTSATAALDAAHRAGLVHGHLTTDSFVLTPNGVLKVMGFGDPPWLPSGLPPTHDPTPDADLRALGQAAFVWSQTGVGAKKRGRGAKGLPEPLQEVIRRLETDLENPMGDTATRAEPYRSAGELLDDLHRLAGKYPCPQESWDELVRNAADTSDLPAARKAG